MIQRGTVIAVGLLLGMCGAPTTYAEEPVVATPVGGSMDQREIHKLELTLGKSKVLDLPTAIKRASLANPEVADTVVLSPTQIYVTGKATGVTNLTLWNENDKMMGVYDVVIGPDLTRLKENLHQALPEEKGILVTSSHDHITLSGTASNANNLGRAMSIAEAYAPKKVVNALQVGGVQQVMLEVRVAEMNRELIKRLGVNFSAIGPNEFGVSVLGGLTTLTNFTNPGVGGGAATVTTAVTSAIQGVFGFDTGSISWTGLVDALKEENLIKVLAKPTLVALNGQEAAF